MSRVSRHHGRRREREREPYRLTFALGDMRGAANLRGQQLEVLLRALVQTNMLRLRRGLALAAMPRYEPHPTGPRPDGEEEWQDAASMMLLGVGDDLDILAAEAARRRLRGEDARILPEVSGERWRPRATWTTAETRWRALRNDERIVFVLDLFNGFPDEALAHATLDVLLDALTEIDQNYLLAHPETPPLYSLAGKLLYLEEPPGQEDWQDVPTCLRMRTADCEDLSCWRTGEAQVRQKVPARSAFSKHETTGGATLYHITTKVAGRPEDPSRFFGMR